MTLTPPHTGVCDRCDGLIIDAALTISGEHNRFLRLDAEPVETGAYRAWNRGDMWIAQPHDAWKHFAGLRRREHLCVIPDKQLELA